MRIYYLSGVILSVTTILVACGEGTPTECAISTARELKQGVVKSGKFAAGTDCEAMRKLAEEGKPLPTIADATTTTAPKAAVTPAQEAFKTPFVAGQKTQELIPTTDKQARVQELEKKVNVDSKQARDPFTSTVINPVPKLETLLAKPKEPPKLRAAVVVKTSNRTKLTPPDTQAAEGTLVTGTVEIAGTIYAIIQSPGESSPRNVQAGQVISDGKVLVKRIDTNAEPPIVVLRQNGVEVLRAVGAPVVASTSGNSTNTNTASPQPTTTPLALPALTPPQ
jgi:hypothetical protein